MSKLADQGRLVSVASLLPGLLLVACLAMFGGVVVAIVATPVGCAVCVSEVS